MGAFSMDPVVSAVFTWYLLSATWCYFMIRKVAKQDPEEFWKDISSGGVIFVMLLPVLNLIIALIIWDVIQQEKPKRNKLGRWITGTQDSNEE